MQTSSCGFVKMLIGTSKMSIFSWKVVLYNTKENTHEKRFYAVTGSL